jgi:hypothetical protein
MSTSYKKGFSLSETTENSSGKSSGSGFIGVLIGLLTGVFILLLMYGYLFQIPHTLEFFDKVLQLGFLAGVLLGVRKAAASFGKESSPKEN